jgi:SagB-type dehydrogenase family enzyme
MSSSNVGDDFQTHTKYVRNRPLGKHLDWLHKPETYKNYPASKIIQLPSQVQETKTHLSEILHKRCSIRDFSDDPLRLADLGFLLWSSTGIQRVEGDYEFRTVPSAGALYPTETYLAVNNVEGLESGIYHYNIENHTLEELKIGRFGQDLARAALNQAMCSSAAVVFIWTAIFERSKWKYSQRAYRYVYLDTGHVAENLALAAVSINLGSCEVGAFFDDEINSLVGVDGEEESAILLCAVGYPKQDNYP